MLPGKEGGGLREDSLESWHMITHDPVSLPLYPSSCLSVAPAVRALNCLWSVSAVLVEEVAKTLAEPCCIAVLHEQRRRRPCA